MNLNNSARSYGPILILATLAIVVVGVLDLVGCIELPS